MSEKKCCKSVGECSGTCERRPLVADGEPLYVMLRDADIYSPISLEELYAAIKQLADKKIRLIFGNTATGNYLICLTMMPGPGNQTLRLEQ